MLSNVTQVTFFRKISYLKYLEFSINGIWILLLILCECEWNMVCCSYVITQVYISFWSSFMTSVSVKNWYDLRFNMTFDAIRLRLIGSYCEHFYGGTGPMPMAFYGPVTCKNYDFPWGTWNRNSYESLWRT